MERIVNDSWTGVPLIAWQPILTSATSQEQLLYFIPVSVIFFLILYYGYIKPMDLQLDLTETGFEYLKDGTYRSAEHRKLSFKQLVQISQKRRAIGNMPPVYPNGWFCLIESADVPPGEVRHVPALGENFAVFRTKKGKVRVMDAYCPHLGANMAIGGSVHGDCLECPFHKWRFSGVTGACTSVPYSAGSPPSAKVKMWPCNEVNHFIFVWYHAEGEQPSYYIQPKPELNEFQFQGRTDVMVACHIEEVQENGADIGHLDALHGSNVMAGADVRHCDRIPFQFLRHIWDAKWEACTEEKHKGIMTISSQVRLFGKLSIVHVDVHVEQIGPSFVELNLKTPFGPMLLFMAVTPVEPLLQRVIHRMYSPVLSAPFSRLLLFGETRMFQRDVMIWNHKKYEMKPHLVKEDRGIARHRRWFSQFYTANSFRFTDQKNTLDW